MVALWALIRPYPFECTIWTSVYCLAFWSAKDVRKKAGIAITLALLCAVYGYGAVICLNGILDSSTASKYIARVINKRASTSRHTSYCLKLSPWGPRSADQEVDVWKSVYEKHKAGDDVVVVV